MSVYHLWHPTAASRDFFWQPYHTDPRHSDQVIPNVKFLGKKFDQNLTVKEHITDLKQSSAGKRMQISNLRGSTTKEVLRNLVSATVMSRVSYGDILYNLTSKNATNKAQMIQNFAARVIAGVPKH